MSYIIFFFLVYDREGKTKNQKGKFKQIKKIIEQLIFLYFVAKNK